MHTKVISLLIASCTWKQLCCSLFITALCAYEMVEAKFYDVAWVVVYAETRGAGRKRKEEEAGGRTESIAFQ